MTAAVDYTGNVLYRYLRALSVKVSRGTVYSLLDIPVGNSMRGISDALDALHIKNEVYQLPISLEYLTQIDAPFITMLQTDKNPFRVVIKKNDSTVEFGNSEHLEVNTFLKQWTGCVLLGTTTTDTPSDTYYRWKNICYFLSKYKIVLAIILIIILGVVSTGQYNSSPTFTAYLTTLAFGIFVSIAILYKELFNERFLERFCHIGKVVDCNQILHSQGASIVGFGLGELSLFYFTTLFLFCVLFPKEYYSIAILCSAVAFCFTLYSVIYQLFVAHKGCMLCMLVNIAVWISIPILYRNRNINQIVSNLSPTTLFILVSIGCICLIADLTIKAIYKNLREKTILQHRMTDILKPEVFQSLLSLETHIEKPTPSNITLQNHKVGDQRLIIITNPNCGICAQKYQQIEELAQTVPMSLIILTFSNDKLGQHVAQTIITAYLMEDLGKALLLLSEWYKNRRLSEAEKYSITPEAKQIWEKQQEYCRMQRISKAPIGIVNGYYIPDIYQLSELKYVLI